jgi:N2227-like protein
VFGAVSFRVPTGSRKLLAPIGDDVGGLGPLLHDLHAPLAALAGSRVSPADFEKVQYVLKNFARDWSTEGAAEREQARAATEKRTDRHAQQGRTEAGRQAGRWTDGRMDRHTHTQTDRQTDRACRGVCLPAARCYHPVFLVATAATLSVWAAVWGGLSMLAHERADG